MILFFKAEKKRVCRTTTHSIKRGGVQNIKTLMKSENTQVELIQKYQNKEYQNSEFKKSIK